MDERSAEVRATDKKGDLVDVEGGGRATGPGYVDMVTVVAGIGGGDLTVVVELAKTVPASVSTTDESLSYTIALETTGDKEWDYWISLDNRESGAFGPSLTDWEANYSYYDDEFPGSMIASDGAVLARISLHVLGDPESIKLCLLTQRTDAAGAVTAEDNAPGADCLAGESYLELI